MLLVDPDGPLLPITLDDVRRSIILEWPRMYYGGLWSPSVAGYCIIIIKFSISVLRSRSSLWKLPHADYPASQPAGVAVVSILRVVRKRLWADSLSPESTIDLFSSLFCFEGE